GRAGGLVLKRRVAVDAVGSIRRADGEREERRAVVADVHHAEQRVLRLVGPGRVAPRAGRPARVLRSGRGGLVTDEHAVLAAVGPVLEPNLPVERVRTGVEERDAGIASLL